MTDLAGMAARADGPVRAEVGGQDATAVAFSTQGECKMVGAWYDANHKAISNFTVCRSGTTMEGSVARMPLVPESYTAVRQVLKAAVLKGSASSRWAEFSISANRLPVGGGGSSCMTELIITSEGLLSFYGVQNACL